MAMAQTSLEAYRSFSYDDLNRMEKKVYDYILRHPDCCNEDIQIGMGIKIQSVTGRVNSLWTQGYIYESGHKFATSGKKVKTWTVSPEAVFEEAQ